MLQDDHIETLTLITSIKAFSKQGHIRSCRGYDMDISLGTHHSTHYIAPAKIHFDIKMKGEFFFPLCPLKIGQGRKQTSGVSCPKQGKKLHAQPRKD